MRKYKKKISKKYVYVLYTYKNEENITIHGVFSSLKKASKIGDEIRKNTNNHTHSFIDRWIVN
ncbi:hypothetical protein CB473P3_00114 [Enterocloster phage CB473P3]|nr:hypothetical protein CB473P3_00114 [Enterocloster phage CB473P3]